MRIMLSSISALLVGMGAALAFPTAEVPKSEAAYVAKVKTAAPEEIVAKSTILMTQDGKEIPLRDENGRIVRTRFEETMLRDLATNTGGRYLRSRTGGDLTKALQEIEAGERKLVGYRTTTDYRDLYPAALATAAGAIALLWLFL